MQTMIPRRTENTNRKNAPLAQQSGTHVTPGRRFTFSGFPDGGTNMHVSDATRIRRSPDSGQAGTMPPQNSVVVCASTHEGAPFGASRQPGERGLHRSNVAAFCSAKRAPSNAMFFNPCHSACHRGQSQRSTFRDPPHGTRLQKRATAQHTAGGAIGSPWPSGRCRREGATAQAPREPSLLHVRPTVHTKAEENVAWGKTRKAEDRRRQDKRK